MNTLPAVQLQETTSSITTFNFAGIDIPCVFLDDEYWFVAKEVCTILGYQNVSQAISLHVLIQKNKRIISQDNLHILNKYMKTVYQRNLLIVNQAGLLELAFSSKKPLFIAFREWVVSEVLPTILSGKTFSLQYGAQESQKALSYTQEQLDQVAKKASTETQLQANAKGVTAGRHTRIGFVRPQYALDTAVEFIRLDCIFDLELIEGTITERDIYNEIIAYVRDNLPISFSDTPDHEILDYSYVYRLVRLRKYALKLLDNTKKEKTKDAKSVFLNYMTLSTHLH